MAQRKKRTRQARDEFEMQLIDAVALLMPDHNQRTGDEWTFFVRDGVLEMVVTRAPEDVQSSANQQPANEQDPGRRNQ